MVVPFFALFSKIGAMLLLTSPERIKLRICACAQIKAREEGSVWVYPDDAGYPSEKEKRGKADL